MGIKLIEKMCDTAKDIKDREKAEKKAKQAKKDAERKEKEQAELVQQYEAKKAAAEGAGDGATKMKEWLKNPPFKCTNADVKKGTYLGIMNVLRDMDDGAMDGLYTKLDIKEAALLNKYYNLAYYYLNKQDGETKNLIQCPKLLKTQLKMNEVYGNAVFMKSCFIK